MKKSSLIGHTVEAYDLILRDKHPADSVLDTFFRSHKYLGSHDRRFVAETVYGMLRYKRRLEWLLQGTSSEASASEDQRRSLLVCLLYLVVYCREEIAKLLEQCEPDPEEKKLLPVVLAEAKERNERFEAASDGGLEKVTRLAIKLSFPNWMIERWLEEYGEEETCAMCSALNTQAPLTLRVNLLKTDVEGCRRALEQEKLKTEATKFSPVGLTAHRRMNIFGLETFQKGFFEVQDEGSQILSLLVDPKPTSKVVDACAGGGGKSLALAVLMKNRGSIYALDTNSYRLDGLRKRIKRSGVDTIRIRAVEADHLPDDLVGTADNVLVDAPCSGLGTIRRNPGTKWTVTPETVAELHVKQLGILTHYARCVKVNGRLVYATCTTMKDENEGVVEKFLVDHPQFELLMPASILKRYQLEALGQEKYFRLKPHVHNTDGFFAAVMRRKE